jgi:hypothetical protein
MKAEQHEEESDNEDGLHVVVMVGWCAGWWLSVPSPPTVLWPSSANDLAEPPNRGPSTQLLWQHCF